jgi:hypothetical protein
LFQPFAAPPISCPFFIFRIEKRNRGDRWTIVFDYMIFTFSIYIRVHLTGGRRVIRV